VEWVVLKQLKTVLKAPHEPRKNIETDYIDSDNNMKPQMWTDWSQTQKT
jgi:hypothetical protein